MVIFEEGPAGELTPERVPYGAASSGAEEVRRV